MRLYARHRPQLIRQVITDLFVLAWIAVWALIARNVHSMISAIAGPARQSATATEELGSQVRALSGEAGTIPGLGTQLRRPLDAAAGAISALTQSAHDQVARIDQVANLLGWVTFLLPVGLVLLVWLPRRIRFARRATAIQRLLDGEADLDLFALRALVRQPIDVLAKISNDPVAAWGNRDPDVMSRLADLELRRNGLMLPRQRRLG